jgi:ABC-type iron transport system FetAB ATPase subunit
MTDVYNLSHSGADVNDAITKVKNHITPIDSVVTAGSTAAVTSGAIKSELNTLQASINTTDGKIIFAGRDFESLSLSTSSGVAYQNNTGYPLFVSLNLKSSSNIKDLKLLVDSVSNAFNNPLMLAQVDTYFVNRAFASGIVPQGYWWKFEYGTNNNAVISEARHYSFRLA